MNTGPVKVLIVDDSLLFREVLARGVGADASIKVVAKAVDAYDARDKIIEFRPDVMVCDIQMPGLSGIEFIRWLLPQYSIPIIVISSRKDFAADALKAGAFDFVLKPDGHVVQGADPFIEELIFKIKASAKAASLSKIAHMGTQPAAEGAEKRVEKVIALGASTGGTEAIYSVLKSLPPMVPGIVIVQHIPIGFSGMFAKRLDSQTGLRVKEAENGDFLEQGSVLLAPGDQHMILKRSGNRYRVECYAGEKVSGHCPSVDVLFHSVAKEAGKNAVGVLMTGMGSDGAKGLLAMRNAGAKTIGQDEKSCVVYGMPKSAYEMGAVEKQVSLADIPAAILKLVT